MAGKNTIYLRLNKFSHILHGLGIRWLDMLDDAGEADRKDLKTPMTADRYIGIYRYFLEEGSKLLKTHQAELQKPGSECFRLHAALS